MMRKEILLLLALAGCEFYLPEFKKYAKCQPACVPGCVCLEGKACVPEKEPFDPRCCQAASCPECTADADCPNALCRCERGVCLTPSGERDPQFCGEVIPVCDPQSPCRFGCVCQDNQCVPPDGEPDPGLCSHGYNSCSQQTDCRVGCECRQGRCWPRADDISFLYCAGQPNDQNNQELLCRGPSYTVWDRSSLVTALEEAAKSAGPYGIIFAPRVTEIVLDADLPPVPSLVWIDGAAGRSKPVTLKGAGAGVGLRIVGSGVVIKSLRLIGFSQAGLVVEGTAREVHLMRLRVGDIASPNNDGVVIEPGASDIFIGRGREIGWEGHCLQVEQFDKRDNCLKSGRDYSDLDVNVVVGNVGDGIRAEGVESLLIEGTWVGFDLAGDCDADGGPRPELENGGAGVFLNNVRRAQLGVRNLTGEELSGRKDFRPGCLAVGRNRDGGVVILGGGNILFHCVFLGNTPYFVPYGENGTAGLVVKENQDGLFFGPLPEARGFTAESLNLIHVTTTPAVKILDNQARVWVRGAQLQSLGADTSKYPASLINVENAQAPVELVHLSIFGHASEAMIDASAGEGGSLSLVNSYLAEFSKISTPVVSYRGPNTALVMKHSLKLRLGEWCVGDCNTTDPFSALIALDALTGSWSQTGSVPLDPACPVVDIGKNLGFDVNGITDGDFSGCCPDIGAFECVTEVCAKRPCSGISCP